jgi:hypothetical protein
MNLLSKSKPDAAKPAMTALFHAGRHWRGVGDTGRWAAKNTTRYLIALMSIFSLLFGG